MKEYTLVIDADGEENTRTVYGREHAEETFKRLKEDDTVFSVSLNHADGEQIKYFER